MSLWNQLSSTVSQALSGGPKLLFTIGEVSPHNDSYNSIWTMHNGIKKDDNTPVTVFVFDCNKSKAQLPLARNALKRSKTIRHPDVLKYIDGVETALKFLNNDCSIVHGNVRTSSIFATKAGEWRLGGLEILCSLKEERPILLEWGNRMPDAWKYTPPELANISWGAAGNLPISAIDSWQYACLIYEIFNDPIQKREDLSQMGKIPKPKLVKIWPTFWNGACKETDFIQANLFLEQFSVKDSTEKDAFLKKLNTTLDTFPTDFCKYKILPELVNALEFGGAGAKALTPILKVGSQLSTDDYNVLILPTVVKLFASPDRSIRISLLESLGSFITHLNNKIVNEKVFPNIATGFLDTSPLIREWTLKSVVLLTPMLSERTINNDLLRYLAKLQTDEEPGIRAVCAVFTGKMAKNLNESTRKKVLIPAFGRSLNDPFPPSRNAGLLALVATIDMYEPADIAIRVLPMTCPLLVDPERNIRTQAFKNVDAFVKRLDHHSTQMTDPIPPETKGNSVPSVSSSSSATSSAGWGSFAFGALSTGVTAGIGALSTGVSVGLGTISTATGISPTNPKNGSAPPSPTKPTNPAISELKAPPELKRDNSNHSIGSAFGSGLKFESAGFSSAGSGGWEDDADWGQESNSLPQPMMSTSNRPNTNIKPSTLPQPLIPTSASTSASVSAYPTLTPAKSGMTFPTKKPAASSWEDWTDDVRPSQPSQPANIGQTQLQNNDGWGSNGGDAWESWDAEPVQQASTSNSTASPVVSFGALSIPALGGSGGAGPVFGTDRELERAKKREQLAQLREQKKAALAAKKASQG